MMAGRQAAFWRGYLMLAVEGDNPGYFIGQALAAGINLWGVRWTGDKKVLLFLQLKDFQQVRPLARQSGCRVRIRRRLGVPFLWRRLRYRQGFLAGGVIFLAVLYLLSSGIWFIQVDSREPLKYVRPEAILKVAAAAGVQVGRPRSGIDRAAAEQRLLQELPQLAWAGLEVQGTRVVIRVVEKVLPRPELAVRDPADLVASRDGVVTEILVLQGQALVKAGDTVSRGQTLIAGETLEPGPGGAVAQGQPGEKPASVKKYVRARGIVRARVWYDKLVDVPLVQVETKLSGNRARQIRFKWRDQDLRIWGLENTPYVRTTVAKNVILSVPWRNHQTIVELYSINYQEVQQAKHSLTPEQARQLGGQVAMQGILDTLPAGAQVVERRLEPVAEWPEKIRVRAILETIEDIGTWRDLPRQGSQG